MVLGLRELIVPNDGLRYSLVPGFYPINTPKGGVSTILIKKLFFPSNYLFLILTEKLLVYNNFTIQLKIS